MEPKGSAEGPGENETGKPQTPEPSQGQRLEDAGSAKETAGDVPVRNGQDRDAAETPQGQKKTLPNCEESPLEEEGGSVGGNTESVVPQGLDPGATEQLASVPLGSPALPPETPASQPVAGGSSDSSSSPPSGPGAEEASPKPRSSPANQPEPPDFYCVKWISWKGERTAVITQSENGPCPLLAIMNILFLQWKVRQQSLQRQRQPTFSWGAGVDWKGDEARQRL